MCLSNCCLNKKPFFLPQHNDYHLNVSTYVNFHYSFRNPACSVMLNDNTPSLNGVCQKIATWAGPQVES